MWHVNELLCDLCGKLDSQAIIAPACWRFAILRLMRKHPQALGSGTPRPELPDSPVTGMRVAA